MLEYFQQFTNWRQATGGGVKICSATFPTPHIAAKVRRNITKRSKKFCDGRVTANCYGTTVTIMTGSMADFAILCKKNKDSDPELAYHKLLEKAFFNYDKVHAEASLTIPHASQKLELIKNRILSRMYWAQDQGHVDHVPRTSVQSDSLLIYFTNCSEEEMFGVIEKMLFWLLRAESAIASLNELMIRYKHQYEQAQHAAFVSMVPTAEDQTPHEAVCEVVAPASNLSSESSSIILQRAGIFAAPFEHQQASFVESSSQTVPPMQARNEEAVEVSVRMNIANFLN